MERVPELGAEARNGRRYESRGFAAELRREADSSTVTFRGYAALYGVEYDVYGGPDEGGWTEVFERGAFGRTLGHRQNRALLHSHDDGRVLATTGAGDLRIVEDDRGLLIEADLDLGTTWIADTVRQIELGHLGEMSHRFRAVRQEWDDRYMRRSISESELFEVSTLWAGANPATVSMIDRDRQTVAELRSATTPPVDRVRIAAQAALAALR